MQTPLVLLSIIVLVTSQPLNLRYVRPHDPSPHYCPGQPCFTLDQYAEEVAAHFVSGSVFVFLAGEHSLTQSIVVEDVSSLSLRGQENGSVNIRVVTHGVCLS